MISNNRDFMFIFDAINTNPNGDPDQENKPRMDNETKTLLVSDARQKRNLRDFLYLKGYDIFVHTVDDTKVTMEKMLDAVMKKYNLTDEATLEERVDMLLSNMIDIRLFGSAMAVKKLNKSFTGPVQMSWGYSLHPVDIIKSSSIVTIMNDDNSTFGKMYKAHYAMVAHSGTVNKYASIKTRLTEDDLDIFRRGLIQAMMNNQTHSKQGQQPLLYLEVVYDEKFDGYIGDLRRFIDVETKKDEAIRKVDDVTVDFKRLTDEVEKLKSLGYIKDVLLWKGYFTDSFLNLPNAKELDLVKPIN